MFISKWITIPILFMILVIIAGSPASAETVNTGVKYMSGSPSLSVYISGTNEFDPGTDTTLPVIISNSGLNQFKFVQSGIINRDDLPNTAKLLMVSLSSGNSPIIIKSDPQMVGDLTGGSTVTSSFHIKIPTDAPSGTYNLPVNINYTYLETANQYGTDTIEYDYRTTNLTLSLPIKIKPDISIQVLSAEPEHLNVGTEGYLNLKIKNIGFDDGKKAVVKIVQNGNSPIIPTDSSVYIGDFPSGSTIDTRYKVTVQKDAERSTYPVDVFVVYENKDGDTVTSLSDTVGIPVGGKIDFTIVSSAAEMNPSAKKVISVQYKNTGDTTAYSAQASISAVDPFTSNDDIAYLGDMKPGDTVTASYEVSVNSDATLKEYGLDSEIRYRDTLDNWYVSDTLKAPVDVVAPSGIAAILSNPIMLIIIFAAIIGIVYGIIKYRSKKA